jgi:hypothetical protein
MKFLNPIPNGKMDSSMFSNTVEFESYNSDTILSPEEGVVVSSDKFKCGGNIKIEHFIEGKTFYSEFCGVDRLMSFRGQQVRRGDILGTIGDSPIKYTIFNSNGSKENVRDFITGAGLTAGIYSKDTKTDDISTDETQDDTKPNKEKVSDKETKKTNSKILSKDGKEKRRREPSYYEKTGTIPNPFIDALILPFHALDAIRMKENIESNEVLKEEISDIKRLIKY